MPTGDHSIYRSNFHSFIHFTCRALCQCLSRTALILILPAPTCTPHRLQQSQVIEQVVQALGLPGMRRLGLGDQRLTHQAYDQAVALDGAHALLQLEQDLVLVLDVAALRLPDGERGGAVLFTTLVC